MMQIATTRSVPFCGNGPYCYSNAMSMLLASIGERFSPSELEAYTAVGLGAFWLPKEKLLFFISIANPPDKGISRALQLLGFNFKETAIDNSLNPPYDQLRSDLQTSPAILGPIDMGYLTHNPLHKRMAGADHFVLAYAMDDDGVSIHDPEGFPSIHLPFSQLAPGWRAENIGIAVGTTDIGQLPNEKLVRIPTGSTSPHCKLSERSTPTERGSPQLGNGPLTATQYSQKPDT